MRPITTLHHTHTPRKWMWETGDEAVAVGEEMSAKPSVMKFGYFNRKAFICKKKSPKEKHMAACKFTWTGSIKKGKLSVSDATKVS